MQDSEPSTLPNEPFRPPLQSFISDNHATYAKTQGNLFHSFDSDRWRGGNVAGIYSLADRVSEEISVRKTNKQKQNRKPQSKTRQTNKKTNPPPPLQ